MAIPGMVAPRHRSRWCNMIAFAASAGFICALMPCSCGKIESVVAIAQQRPSKASRLEFDEDIVEKLRSSATCRPRDADSCRDLVDSCPIMEQGEELLKVVVDTLMRPQFWELVPFGAHFAHSISR